MSETKKCKYCKEEIAKDAKICPNCRKKQGSKKWLIIIAVIVVIIIAAVGVSGGSKESSGKINSGSESSSAESSKEYTVGEYVEKNDVKVSFISIKNKNGSDFFQPKSGNTFVYAEFEIENKSDKELSISSVMCFDAYFDGYSASTSISALSADDSVSSIDGTVGPGKKIKGVIAYEVSSDWKEFEVKVTPDFWGSDGIVFKADSSQSK